RPVLLGSSRSRVSMLGVAPRVVLSLRTSGDARVLTGPPATTWPLQYVVWMASPPEPGPAAGGAWPGSPPTQGPLAPSSAVNRLPGPCSELNMQASDVRGGQNRENA